jgi:hypothetical protein
LEHGERGLLTHREQSQGPKNQSEPGEVRFAGLFADHPSCARSIMVVEELHSPGAARDRRTPLHLAMTFEGDALVLGAGTRLGLANRGLLQHKQDGEAGDEARVAALLAAAYGRAIAPSELAYIRGALEKQSEGQTSLALVYLALANLPKLQPPAEAAWRLSAADALMKGGMAPWEILEALGIGKTAGEEFDRAYNPEQPRVPAGNGRESGRWTSGDGADDGATDDAASPPGAPNGSSGDGSRGVQIADDSDDWPQYLSPVSSAQAAEAGRPPFNGVGPNAQHQAGVARAIALYQANGFIVASDRPVAVNVPGFTSPRVYDFVVIDPVTGSYIGVEVKTTMYDTIFFDSSQVDFLTVRRWTRTSPYTRPEAALRRLCPVIK